MPHYLVGVNCWNALLRYWLPTKKPRTHIRNPTFLPLLDCVAAVLCVIEQTVVYLTIKTAASVYSLKCLEEKKALKMVTEANASLQTKSKKVLQIKMSIFSPAADIHIQPPSHTLLFTDMPHSRRFQWNYLVRNVKCNNTPDVGFQKTKEGPFFIQCMMQICCAHQVEKWWKCIRPH